MRSKIGDCRRDFPALGEKIHSHPLVYFDNAATTQMPIQVMDAMRNHLLTSNGNVHRGMHTLSLRSTSAFEQARENVRAFISAADVDEIIFTSGTTASVNLLASSFGGEMLKEGGIILVSEMEHHSNFVPWQQICHRSGAELRIVPVNGNGDIDLETLNSLLTQNVRLLSITWVSNVTGCVNPVRDIIRLAHEKGIPVFVDAAQAVRHFPINVIELDCDFLAFSAHKMMGPTGIGALYAKHDWLQRLQPVSFGGGMVKDVGALASTFEKPPFKFEAGTPNYVGAVGLSAAIDYLTEIGISNISAWEHELTEKCLSVLQSFPEIKIIGRPAKREGVISFVINGMHPTDTALLLDSLGIAVRSGHHCALPLLKHFGVESTVRISPAFYNTEEELEALNLALGRILVMKKGRDAYDSL